MRKVIFNMLRLLQYLFVFTLFSFSSALLAINEKPDSLILLPDLEQTVQKVVDEGPTSVQQFVDSIVNYSSPYAMSRINGLINFYQAEKEYENSEWNNASISYQKSLSSFIEIGDSSRLSVIYNNLGLVYFYQAFYDNAIELFQRSLEIDFARGDRMGVAQCYQNMGLVLEAGEEFDRSIDMYMKSLEVYFELEARPEIASIYNNLAACYARLNQHKKAEEKYLQALTLFRELKNLEMEARVMYNIGVLLVRKEEYEQGGKYIEHALVLFKTNKDRIGEVNAYASLGDMYLGRKDYNQAVYLYNYAEKKAKELNYREVRLSNLFSLYSTYKLLGAWEKALTAFEDYSSHKDTLMLDNELYGSGIMDEATAQRLLNRELTLAKVKRNNHLYIAGLILLSLLTLFAFLLAASSRRRLNRCHHNYEVQNHLMLSRMKPDYILPLLFSLNCQQSLVEDKEQVIRLIRNILHYSGTRLIYLDQELDFIQSYCSAYSTVNKIDVRLNVETNLSDSRMKEVMVPSMLSLFFLGAVIGEAEHNLPEKININAGFILQDNFLDVFLGDDGPVLPSYMYERILKHYLTILEASCDNELFHYYKKFLAKQSDLVVVKESKHLGKEGGNQLKIRLPLLVK